MKDVRKALEYLRGLMEACIEDVYGSSSEGEFRKGLACVETLEEWFEENYETFHEKMYVFTLKDLARLITTLMQDSRKADVFIEDLAGGVDSCREALIRALEEA